MGAIEGAGAPIKSRSYIGRSKLAETDVERGGAISVRDQGGLPLFLLNELPLPPVEGPARRIQLVLKRWALDVPLSLLGLLTLSPLLVAIAMAVSWGSGSPVLFAQERLGLGGKPFRMLKFRTTRRDAADPSGLTQITADDHRVTKLGRYLRASSLDELPQLWNVLLGQMSIIGPRPMVAGQRAADRDYREVVPFYDYRLVVKPGLSGWAQANGLRGTTADMDTARRRIEYDCAYIQNFSLILDLKIILLTVFTALPRNDGV